MGILRAILHPNSHVLFVLMLLLSQLTLTPGCSTPGYRLFRTSVDGLTVLDVASERVLLECEALKDADDPSLFGFMIHVLDNDGAYTNFVQTNTVDKEFCERHLKQIGDLLKRNSRVLIAGRGDLTVYSAEVAAQYADFPGFGHVKSNGIVLSFAAIGEERGRCYDVFYGYKAKACPPEPFPPWR